MKSIKRMWGDLGLLTSEGKVITRAEQKRHAFSLNIKPEQARKMTKAQYKAATRYLRLVRRIMEQNGVPEIMERATAELMAYGRTTIKHEVTK